MFIIFIGSITISQDNITKTQKIAFHPILLSNHEFIYDWERLLHKMKGYICQMICILSYFLLYYLYYPVKC